MIEGLNNIGFMQGRLSPLANGRIQSFPWDCWRNEFLLARKIGIHLMEWTLDQERLQENPLMTKSGQSEIRDLSEHYSLDIPSLTGDCFMQAPFWKANGSLRLQLEKDFIEIVIACAKVGIAILVLPLVDNGALENMHQEDDLVKFLEENESVLSENSLKVAFESDYSPDELSRFIQKLDPNFFGINYDIGNSAALGFGPKEEFEAYGNRVLNVHIKDRKFGGTTVPLGEGDACFDVVFSELKRVNYQGNYILQTARASGNEHAEVLSRYRDQTLIWLQKYAA